MWGLLGKILSVQEKRRVFKKYVAFGEVEGRNSLLRARCGCQLIRAFKTKLKFLFGRSKGRFVSMFTFEGTEGLR